MGSTSTASNVRCAVVDCVFIVGCTVVAVSTVAVVVFGGRRGVFSRMVSIGGPPTFAHRGAAVLGTESTFIGRRGHSGVWVVGGSVFRLFILLGGGTHGGHGAGDGTNDGTNDGTPVMLTMGAGRTKGAMGVKGRHCRCCGGFCSGGRLGAVFLAGRMCLSRVC